jgi:DNA-directed RNA polymerase subunit M/transcription elongation factor TFIIS
MPPKVVTLRRKATSVKSTPTQQQGSGEDLLSRALAAVPIYGDRRLSQEEYNTLNNLYFPDGTKMLILPDQAEFVVFVISLLRQLPFVEVINYLQGQKDRKSAILQSPLLRDEAERARIELDNVQKNVEVEEGVYQCMECGSRKTSSIHKQIRSADEPMSILVTCKGCGKGWRID